MASMQSPFGLDPSRACGGGGTRSVRPRRGTFKPGMTNSEDAARTRLRGMIRAVAPSTPCERSSPEAPRESARRSSNGCVPRVRPSCSQVASRRAARRSTRNGASFVRADARDAEQIRASVGAAENLLGGLDALVLNAGVLHDAPLSGPPTRPGTLSWRRIFGPYLYAVACLPLLRDSENASITAISSDAGVWGETSIGAYSVSKRGLNMLVQTLAVEAGPAGIRVNAVCPGDTAPGMATHVDGRAATGDTSDGPCHRLPASARAQTSPPRWHSLPRQTGPSATARCSWSTAGCEPRSGRAPSPRTPEKRRGPWPRRTGGARHGRNVRYRKGVRRPAAKRGHAGRLHRPKPGARRRCGGRDRRRFHRLRPP